MEYDTYTVVYDKVIVYKRLLIVKLQSFIDICNLPSEETMVKNGALS